MASKEQLKQELNRYKQLKAKLNVCIPNLISSHSNMSLIKSSLEEHYQINGRNSNIFERVSKLDTDVIETSNYLKNVIIPAIDRKISQIEAEIRRLEEEDRRQAQAIRRGFYRW